MNYYTYGGNGSNFVYLGIDKSGKSSADKIYELVRAMTDIPFVLIAFEAENWNAEFSPWEAGAVFGNEPFAGKGKETLLALESEIIPDTEENRHKEKRYIAGYSLAGLFSLWAFYESGAFDGAASCSGSLWFPEWTDYASSHKANNTGAVYLSLGDKEERTKNKLMSCVGDNTRLQEKLLAEDKNIAAHTLEWNSGGHFSEPDNRTAKGIVWLLNNG